MEPRPAGSVAPILAPPVPADPAGDRLDGSRRAIAHYLAGAARRLRSRGRYTGAAIAVRAFCGGTVLLAVLAAVAPGLDARATAGWALAALAAGLWVSARVARQRLDANAVADAIGRAEPALGDELRSFVELDGARARGRLTGGEAFLILLGDRVARASQSRSLDELLPLRPARQVFFRAVALCGLGLVAVSFVSPRLLPDLALSLRRGTPSTPPPPLPPIIGDLELELVPPPYTGLPSRSIPASSGDVRALAGTEIRVRARSLVGLLRRAELRVEGESGRGRTEAVEVTRPSATGVPVLSTHFRVEEAGTYRFVLWRWTGRLAEPNAHRIDLEPDAPPRVELRTPGDPLELDSPRPVELAYEAEDDFGIDSVELVFKIDERPEQRQPLAPERLTPRHVRGRSLWELAELEREGPLPAGTHVSYWVEARDNDAVGGKKAGRSQTYTIILRGKVDAATVDQGHLEALLEATITALADRLEPGTGDKHDDEAHHTELAALAAKYAEVGRLHDAVVEGKKPKGATAALRALAAAAAVRLQKLVSEEAGAAGPRGTREKIEAELERDALLLDDLRGRRRLEEMGRLAEEMRQVRDDLRRLFDELKTATSETHKAELRREIERKLTELESKMAELRRIAAKAEGEVPDEFLNREAIGKAEVNHGIDEIRKLLAKGDLDHAMQQLTAMSRSLDQLKASLDADRDRFRGERDPEAEKALSALENDLADLAKEEREIASESRALRDHAADQLDKAQDLKALRERLRPKLAEIDRRAAEQLRDDRLVDREGLDRFRARAQAVGRALDGDDLDEARQMAAEARQLGNDLSETLRAWEQQAEAEAQARVGEGPTPALRRSAKRMAEAEQLARQVEAELERTADKKPTLSEADRRRLDELQKRQQSAQQRGEALSRKLGQPDSPGLSGLPEDVRKDVDAARQSMSESGRELARPAPGRGADAAAHAAEQLDAARGRVQQSRREGDNPGSGGSGSRGKDHQEVLIPGRDAAPRAFREELLDAMKRGAPRRFEDQVRQYYEELVK